MANTLKVADVFLSITPELSGDDPHYHIVVYKSFDDKVIVVHTTKEVNKVRERCCKREKIKFNHIDPDTMVLINNSQCASLKFESAIDCNKAILKPITYFTGKQYFKQLAPISDMQVIANIIRGIKLSPIVEDSIKNLL